ARVQCKNNLHQIGIALISFHDRKNGYPPGYLSNLAADGTETGPGWGWGFFLLSDLDQEIVKDQANAGLDIANPANASARLSTLKIFQCPAESAPPTFTVFNGNGQPLCDVAYGNYIAVNGNAGVSDNAGDNDG